MGQPPDAARITMCAVWAVHEPRLRDRDVRGVNRSMRGDQRGTLRVKGGEAIIGDQLGNVDRFVMGVFGQPQLPLLE